MLREMVWYKAQIIAVPTVYYTSVLVEWLIFK